MLIAAGDRLEKEGRGVWFEGRMTYFVDDELMSAKPGERRSEGSRLMSVLEPANPPGGGVKQDTVASMAGRTTQCDRQVWFPGSWRVRKNDIVVVTQILSRRQGPELVFLNPWPMGRSEFIHCVHGKEPGGFDSKCRAGVVSGVDFCF